MSEVPISFYCQDCRLIVETDKIGNLYKYKCQTCQGENVAFGTTKAIENFYHTKAV